MDEDRTSRNEEQEEPATKPEWRVDTEASRARLEDATADGADGGKLVYTDEDGHQRRLPADMSQLGAGETAAAARALSYELGAPEPSYAQIAAIERLNEMHAAGTVSDENFQREKRRLLGLG